MVNRPKTPPTEAATSLRRVAAAVYRQKRGEPRKFLCMATHVGNGMFATISDRAGREDWGKDPYYDLVLDLINEHGVGFRTLWVDWCAMSPLAPIMYLKVRRSGHDQVRACLHDPVVAPMTKTVAEYTKFWYLSLCHGMFGAPEPDKPPVISEGCIFHQPQRSWYRSGADEHPEKEQRHTICVHGDMSYPSGRHDVGAPVVDADGHLIGVVIGGDLGPESSHQGAYMPAELVVTFARLIEALTEEMSKRGRWRVINAYDIDSCSHSDYEAEEQAEAEGFA